MSERDQVVITLPYDQYLDLKTRVRTAERESDIACQALHEYRDVLSVEVDPINEDSRQVANGMFSTGRRADEALSKMRSACKRRRDEYERLKAL